MNNIKFVFGSGDFTDREGALQLTDEETQHLIDDVVEDLNESIGTRTPTHCYCGTGDTMVFGFTYFEEGTGLVDSMYIYVCKNYYEGQAWIEDGKLTKMNWKEEGEEEKLRGDLEKYSKDELIEMLINKL